ncbi:NAD-dependent protein deacetylase [Balamuthia mandrillaris]
MELRRSRRERHAACSKANKGGCCSSGACLTPLPLRVCSMTSRRAAAKRDIRLRHRAAPAAGPLSHPSKKKRKQRQLALGDDGEGDDKENKTTNPQQQRPQPTTTTEKINKLSKETRKTKLQENLFHRLRRWSISNVDLQQQPKVSSGEGEEEEAKEMASLAPSSSLSAFVVPSNNSFPHRDSPNFGITTTVPLRSCTLAGIAHHIAQRRCERIVVMTGAGISVASGIPDFRSPGTGLYYNLQQYNLPTPTSIFDIEYFKQRPEPFFHLAKELYPGKFQPNAVHCFIKLLWEKGLLLRNYTQNIDALERLAGVPEEALVEAHGSFFSSGCTNAECRKQFNYLEVKEHIEEGRIPRCDQCSHLIKPNITFFGEALPERFFSLMEKDFAHCDLLIVIGTSLKVKPFSELIRKVPPNTPRLLINRQEVGKDWDPTGRKGGFRFNECDNKRDVLFLGDCIDGVQCLAKLLGWDEELDSLVRHFNH